MATFQCLLFHYMDTRSVGCVSGPHTLPLPASDRAWTQLCVWLPAVAALFRLRLTPQLTPPPSFMPRGPQRKAVCRADCFTGWGVGVASHSTSDRPQPTMGIFRLNIQGHFSSLRMSRWPCLSQAPAAIRFRTQMLSLPDHSRQDVLFAARPPSGNNFHIPVAVLGRNISSSYYFLLITPFSIKKTHPGMPLP